jgi:hypothetical protein
MTRIEQAVKIVSDLYEFYRKIPKVSNLSSVSDEKHNQALQGTARERVLHPSESSLARRR